jgi:serine O-acetyltransferase
MNTNTHSISAKRSDWQREKRRVGYYQPWKSFLATIRRYQWLKRNRNSFGRLFLVPVILLHRFWSAVCGIDIPLRTNLGGGLLLPHPNGIVIHPDAQVGVNCLIFQQVTIGMGPKEGVPVIGGHVDIGAGAKLLGGIKVGDHARIGANSVVIEDVPAGATVVGIPAKIVRSR